jgi:ATP-dependent DNA ligase
MIKPMLAYKVDKKPIDWTNKVFVQPKLDGVRCIFTKDGAYSRNNKEFKNLAHIKYDLEDFFKKYPNTVLDGELYNHDLKHDFEKIISLVRKQKPTDEDRSEAASFVQYHVYDTPWLNHLVPSIAHYEARYNWLRNNLPIAKTMTLIANTTVNSIDEAKMLHDIHLAQGYEGSMLRTNGLYEQKRSYNLQKFKDFSDTEAFIVGYEAGKGKFEGLIGKFLMCDDDGNEFGCPIGKGYNFTDRKYILDNIHEYVGKRATFTYFQRTKAGSYRHPLFKTLRNYE